MAATSSALSLSSGGSTSSVGAKRARASSAMNGLPALPELSGDIYLEVMTHRSTFHSEALRWNDEFGDTDRLAALGKRIVDFTAALCLFSKHPMLTAEELESQISESFSDTNVDDWLNAYGLRAKLRCSKEAYELLHTPSESRFLFNSYVGGAYVQHGMGVVKWLGRLIDPESDHAVYLDSAPEVTSDFKRMKIEHQFSVPPQSSLASVPSQPTQTMPPPPPPPPPNEVPPPPPLQSAPPLPSGDPDVPMSFSFDPAASAADSSSSSAPFSSQDQTAGSAMGAYLPLFNQMATQRRMTHEYKSEFTGPSHACQWSIKCIVNGVERGHGTGSNKQLAKEEAAKQAYYALGWGPRNAPEHVRSSSVGASSASVSGSSSSGASHASGASVYSGAAPYTGNGLYSIKPEPVDEYSPLRPSVPPSPSASSSANSVAGGGVGVGGFAYQAPPHMYGGAGAYRPPYGAGPSMSPYVQTPPAMPNLPPKPPNPLAPAQPTAAFLPLFNQTANQRRLNVEYPAEFAGPPHAGRWSVKCVVNGIVKGTGAGPSKQLAKEVAAREAYHAMGWAPRG